MDNRINLREVRDFSDKLNATFLFVRQNFKNLFLSLLLLGLPVMIFGNILLLYFQNEMQKQIFENYGRFPFDLFPGILLTILVMMVGYTWLYTVTVSYIAEYLDGNTDIAVGRVFSRAVSKIGNVIGAGIIAGILTAIAFVFLILPGIYMAIALSFVFIVIILEGDPTFEAISRSFQLIRGNWWSTFGLLIVMSFIVGIMQIVFTIPTYVITFVRALHQEMFTFDSATIGANVVQTIGYTLLYPLSFIALAFQYFSIVEAKENAGLNLEIEQAGNNTPQSPVNEGDF